MGAVVINNSNNYVRFEVLRASNYSNIFLGHVSVELSTSAPLYSLRKGRILHSSRIHSLCLQCPPGGLG
jgi:hypothetical protein